MSARRLLPLVLIAALAVRVWGLNFGLPFYNTRVDETAMAAPAVSFLSGDLRPIDFMYPTAFRYVVAGEYVAWYWISKPFGVYSSLDAFANRRYQTIAPFFYPIRGLSALMGTLTVWCVFLMGRRAFDETVALVAAGYMALAYLHVRDSHFGTSDVTMICLVVVAMLAVFRWRERGRIGDAVIAGLVVGLAGSVKYNGLGAGALFAAAVIEHVFAPPGETRLRLSRAVATLLAFGAAVCVAFFVTSPYALIDWHRFLTDLAQQRSILAQGHGMATTRGWIHHGTVNLPAALGWPLYVAGLLGMVGIFARRWRVAVVLFSFPIVYYLVTGAGYRVFARDALPHLPFLCLAAGWLTCAVIRAIVPQANGRMIGWTTAALATTLVLPSAINVWRLDRILSRTDTRVEAARTLSSVIAPGSVVYQSGETYGQVPFELSEPPLAVDLATFDEKTGRFEGGQWPAWIILPRSPLVLYSRIPAGIETIVREKYDLVQHIPATHDDHPRVYDQQDALFLPLSDLSGVERIGPTIDVYRVRAAR